MTMANKNNKTNNSIDIFESCITKNRICMHQTWTDIKNKVHFGLFKHRKGITHKEEKHHSNLQKS